jgi:hypothetical protein
LREFDGAAFEAGERWRCVVKPPLPYTLRFDVSLTEVVEYQRVRATVDGDIIGWAELSAHDHNGGVTSLTPWGLGPPDHVDAGLSCGRSVVRPSPIGSGPYPARADE